MSWGVMNWNGVIDEGWRKGPWTAEEDRLLIQYVRSHGEGRWNSVARLSGLKRNGKSCRLRWVNYLRPDLKRGQITPHEESIILELHARWGNRWSTIARSLPGRTDNEIKNYWRTHFKKKAKSAPEKAARTRLLKRQQFQQQQKQEQLSQLEMKKMASLLEDNKVGYVPQLRQPEIAAANLYTNTAATTAQQQQQQQQYELLQSVINGSNVVEAEENCMNVEENMNVLWDGLWWNLEDFHGHGHFKPAMHTNNYNLLAPFC